MIRKFFDVNHFDRASCCGVRACSPFLVPGDAILEIVSLPDVEGRICAPKNVDEVHHRTDDDAIVGYVKSRLSVGWPKAMSEALRLAIERQAQSNCSLRAPFSSSAHAAESNGGGGGS